jgi:hypothetical protein
MSIIKHISEDQKQQNINKIRQDMILTWTVQDINKWFIPKQLYVKYNIKDVKNWKNNDWDDSIKLYDLSRAVCENTVILWNSNNIFTRFTEESIKNATEYIIDNKDNQFLVEKYIKRHIFKILFIECYIHAWHCYKVAIAINNDKIIIDWDLVSKTLNKFSIEFYNWSKKSEHYTRHNSELALEFRDLLSILTPFGNAILPIFGDKIPYFICEQLETITKENNMYSEHFDELLDMYVGRKDIGF